MSWKIKNEVFTVEPLDILDIDTCIAIRTVVFKDGKGYVQAGAGIVNDSVPEKEFMETKNKALAVVNAVKEAARL